MIQWFPGHMAKGLAKIKEKQSLIDLFVVVLDARAPLSSYNEEFDKIAPHKPRLFVITKPDLGDIKKFEKIKKEFINKSDALVIVNLKKASAKKIIIREMQKLLKTKKERDARRGILKPRLRAIVVGIPNSGKSTLINNLAGKKQAKVGNMPGVTKGQQWVNIGDIQLLDTPGILWPKFEDQLTGIKLAIIGSIKVDILPKDEIANEGYKLLSKYYPEKLLDLGLKPSKDVATIYSNLINLAKSKKFILKDNTPDKKRAIIYFINYLKNLSGVTYD